MKILYSKGFLLKLSGFLLVFSMNISVLWARQVNEVVLPWVSNKGTLHESLFTKDTRQNWRGPTSFRIGPDGSIYVLNTLGSTVEEFSSEGIHKGTFTIPSFTANDEERVCLDLVVFPDRTVCVLEESHREIFIFNSDRTVKETISVASGSNTPVLLSSLDCDSRGNFYVLNGYDNSVTIFSHQGEKLSSHMSPGGSAYTVDSQGNLLSVIEKAREKENIHAYDVISYSPKTRKTSTVASYIYNAPLAGITPIGVLEDNSIFVEMARGFVEKVDSYKVMVFDGKGIVKGLFSVSRPPVTVSMIRSRVVVALGGVACASVNKKGFVIRFYE